MPQCLERYDLLAFSFVVLTGRDFGIDLSWLIVDALFFLAARWFLANV